MDTTLHVDCGSCTARGQACRDCVVSVLLGVPEEGLRLDHDERAALDALASSGLVPPLRLLSERTQARTAKGEPVQSPICWSEYA